MTTVQRDRASYTDPNGYVYWEDGRVFRRIYAGRAAFFKPLLEAPRLKAMMAAGQLVETQLEREDAEGLVLSHKTIPVTSYPIEWCTAMRLDAARLIVDVAIGAAEAGYQLADGHPWNVMFDGPTPRFIDWGSLVEPSPTVLWPAQVQFNRFCLYPLHAAAAGAGELSKARLGDLALGIDAAMLWTAMGTGYKAAHPVVSGRVLANRTAIKLAQGDRMVEAREGAAGEAKGTGRGLDPVMVQKLRPGFLRGIRRELDAIKLPGGQGGWEAYYAERPSMREAEDADKLALLERLLAQHRPASVIDLGANTGRYSLLAAKAGASVVAVDQDDASMGRLYADAKAQGARVLPIVMDLANPTPASGWCAEQRADGLTRVRSEAVLMLAVIHHLVFTGNASLEQVARLAERACTKLAFIEWVGPEDAMSKYLRRTATKDFGFYTLEAFTAAMSDAGFTVEALPPHAEHRRMLVASRANA